jgi:hypothetical protein
MSTNNDYENRQSNIPTNQGKTPVRTPKIYARTLPTSNPVSFTKNYNTVGFIRLSRWEGKNI